MKLYLKSFPPQGQCLGARMQKFSFGMDVAFEIAMEYIGYIGVVAFALAWIPQSLETIKAGRCDVNPAFLGLAALGSFCLMDYAILRGDRIFSVLNGLTTLGAMVNFYYRLLPRTASIDASK